MPRTRLITPLLLLALMGGLLQHAASATSGPQAYAGTITVATESFWPPTPTMFGYNLGVPWLWDSPIVLDGHDNYFPDLAARVPTSTNGDIRVVGGNEVVTVRLKPNMRWSDGSPITLPTTSARWCWRMRRVVAPSRWTCLEGETPALRAEGRRSRPPPRRPRA